MDAAIVMYWVQSTAAERLSGLADGCGPGSNDLQRENRALPSFDPKVPKYSK